MTDFWWGVLALPLIALTLAAAIAAVFGSWLLLEKWARGRYRKLEPIKWPEDIGAEMNLWTMGDLGQRGTAASTILAGAHVRMLRLGSGAVFFAWGKPKVATGRKIQTALRNALLDVTKAETT